MTRPSRLSLCLCLLLVWLTAGGCSEEVVSGLDERDANEVILVLARGEIAAEKEPASGSSDRWAVQVQAQDAPRAYSLLHNAGLPRRKRSGFRAVYRERGLVPGRLEERALFISALQEELAETLESVPGVVTVRVHATLADRAPNGRRDAPATNSASVLIGYYPNGNGQPPLPADEVKKLIANAVAGLSADRVAVVFAARSRPAPEEPPPSLHASASGGRWRWLAASVAAISLLAGLWSLARRLGFRPRSVFGTNP